MLYEILRTDLDTIDAAIDAIADAQRVHRSHVSPSSYGTRIHMHWDGGNTKLVQVRWDQATQAWVAEDDGRNDGSSTSGTGVS